MFRDQRTLTEFLARSLPVSTTTPATDQLILHLNYVRRREEEKRKNQIRDFISRSFNWPGQPRPTGEEVKERTEVDLPLDTTTTVPDPLTLHYTERSRVSSRYVRLI